ncbi:MAG: hypothetical protein AAFY88_22320 [Acidobacteriota bacterium]
MSHQDNEELIQSWKEGKVTGPAGDIELDDSDLEKVSGGAHLRQTVDTTGTCEVETGDCCGGTGDCLSF